MEVTLESACAEVECIDEVDRKIDRPICDLYDFTAEEIRIVEEK